MTKNTFVCELCEGTFEKAWTDAEALAEMDKRYGHGNIESYAIVCTECMKFIAKVMMRIGH